LSKRPSNTYRKTVLPNGVRLVTEHIPHVRSVSMGIWVTVGSRDEHGGEAGISHFIEHMIFKGTKRRDAQQIARETDSIGGAANAFTGKETTCFHAKVLDEHVPTMVDLLSDIFLESIFATREIERERQVVLQEIGLAQDTPDEYVHDLLGEVMWGSHSLGGPILGTAESVKATGRRHIKCYMGRAYGPESIIISAAGNLKHEEMLALIEPAFGALPTNGPAPVREAPALQAGTGVFGRELEQVHVCMGLKGLAASSGERYAAAVLNVILGGSMSSRLFQIIREQKGLAYSIYSFQSGYVDAGMMGVYVGVEKTQVAKTLKLITREVKRLKRDLVDAGELEAAKKHLRGGILLASENTDNRMTRLAKNEINFGRFLTYDEMIGAMERVSAEDIRALANDLFRDEHLSMVLLGPIKEEDVPGLKLN
jgi:predicted Zn-dependent peptidase